ncbi:hypothetical protein [Tepidanaerobacter syntrophicus]|uniref:hypothetical protein n=1 Tax=Tepidanaerobacter syntrophicus TaxID=224999 RepID=UPI001BD3934E|nr:hypothetical protein [Tepidanaerobacter syntrophicus]
MREMIGKCALCYRERELQLSHIIPKFVIRYLKKTSVGNIRRTDNPNKVVQDGEKRYLLCKECEERFNSAETLFANKVFYPYLKENKEEFEYDKWLHYFITSVNWRNLYLDIIDFVKAGDIEIDDLQVLIDSEKIMRDYLMKKRNDIGNIKNHIFFFGDIKEAYKEFKEQNPHVAFSRSEGGYTFYSSKRKTYMSISNLMGIILITIYRMHREEYWENTEIFNCRGIIRAKNQYIKSIVGQEFFEWIKEMNESQLKLNLHQKEKIAKNIIENKEEFINSKMFKQMMKDRKL